MKSIKISLIINILVVLMTIFASVVMFTGFRFMTGYEPYLESTKIGMFRFFTNISYEFFLIHHFQ